jgi:hypothetical protein
MLASHNSGAYNPTMSDNENSFSSVSNEDINRLFEIDAAFTDPFLERVLNMARSYNKTFQETTPTPEEKVIIESKLDENLGNIFNSFFHFTGMVTCRDLENEELTTQAFLSGAKVKSDGFIITPESQYVGGEYMGEVYTVKHHLFARYHDVYGDDSEETENTIVYVMGDIDASSIELDTASLEHATAWLSNSYPDVLNEIKQRMFNDTDDEGEAYLALKGIDFNAIDMNDTFTRNCVNVYLQSTIEIDDTAPYYAELDGLARPYDDESVLCKLSDGSVLLYMNSIVMLPAFTLDKEDASWVLSAHISVLPTERTEDMTQFVVPIDTIQSLKSVRRTFYNTDT